MENTTTRTANWLSDWDDYLTSHPILNITDRRLSFQVPNVAPEKIALDEKFWTDVRKSFPVSDRVINLNNGAVSSSPFVVEKAFTSYYTMLNSAPSYYIWKVMEPGKEVIREGLANLINCSKDEVAIFRNATEALNNAIFGIELNAGDEVVACKQDYAKTIASWKQRELREGIKINWVEITGSDTNEAVLAKYISAFTPKTKVVQLTHVINWNGQVTPVKEIVREAKTRNIITILDAAHSFGLLDTDVTDLDCDYFGTALHKWLSGPIPSGMLYVKKERIKQTWPFASAADPKSDDIRKFEELSIQLLPNIIGLGYAIEFHLRLGRRNNEERLRHLRRYWTSQLQNTSHIKFNTPLKEDQCVTIVNIAIADWEPVALEKYLLEENGIHVLAVLRENMNGIRITPNIYNKQNDLDALIKALRDMAVAK
jgi:selenocysteine lyase/cysteine desulfurase